MNLACGGGSSSVFSSALKAAPREHVHFVEDVDLVARRHRRIADGVVDLADVVDAVVGGGVHLEHVDVAAVDDGLAVHAHHRHLDGGRGDRAVGQFVIERAGENAGGGGLADPAHAGEDPGLRDAAGLERVRDRAHHGVLADEVVEGGGAVFAREHAVAAGRRVGRGGTRAGRVRGLAHTCYPRKPEPGRRTRRRAAGGLSPKDMVEIGWEADERPDPCSLGLLPSGSDPVGEWLVHRQPPGPYIGRMAAESKFGPAAVHAAVASKWRRHRYRALPQAAAVGVRRASHSRLCLIP